ncbi:hypothetical protein AB833_15085 [Chromatiales bacterium (ex Bugula neritina AB1)]|nr:hypothetical protein AB833_15085 [Chromatiales bacterium (ex Bugula neritina AB1)]
MSKKSFERLTAASEAIYYAKNVFSYGAGNQEEALESSDFNSYFRMKVARDNKAFSIPSRVTELAKKNPIAFKAAKAELSKGGNCGEHAYVVYDYLRRKFPNEHIQIAQKEGFDHAFVLIGDPSKEKGGEVVVADAWPTDPTPVLWEDHFAFSSDRKKIINHGSSKGDARNYKQEMLDAGLSLNSRGNMMIDKSYGSVKTKQEIENGSGWVWNHRATHAGTQFNYTTDSGS